MRVNISINKKAFLRFIYSDPRFLMDGSRWKEMANSICIGKLALGEIKGDGDLLVDAVGVAVLAWRDAQTRAIHRWRIRISCAQPRQWTVAVVQEEIRFRGIRLVATTNDDRSICSIPDAGGTREPAVSSWDVARVMRWKPLCSRCSGISLRH